MHSELTHAFSDVLAKGLGRAHLLLEAGPPSVDDVEALIEACLTNVAYDPQIEDSRAPYLYELVQLAGLTDRVAEILRSSLDDAEADDYAIAQRWELAGLLARGGVDEIREAMYPALKHLADGWVRAQLQISPTAEPARQLLLLDPSSAAFAFAQLGRLVAARPSYADSALLLEEARLAVGPELDDLLAETRRGDSNVDAFLQAVEDETAAFLESAAQRSEYERARQRMGDLPWSDAQGQIEQDVRGTGQAGVIWSHWGTRAPQRELEAAATALVELPPEDVELLRPYLCVFGRRAFPLDPKPIVELLDDTREKVAWFAANALAMVAHPDIRAAALRMAEAGPLRERSIDLLAANWRPGDEQVVERLLLTELDTYRTHTMCRGLLKVAEREPSRDLVPSLLLGYERTPCSECRGAFVEALMQLRALPDELRAECRWDSRSETRHLVAEG